MDFGIEREASMDRISKGRRRRPKNRRPAINCVPHGWVLAVVISLVAIMSAWECGAASAATPYFTIEIVDSQTGRGVPLVEVRTVNGISLYSDSNGLVAFHEPGLMDRDVFFYISSHGYEFPADGFGFQGKVLRLIT